MVLVFYLFIINMYAASLIKPSEAVYNRTHYCGLGREWADPQLRVQYGPDTDKAEKVIWQRPEASTLDPTQSARLF